MKVLIALTCLFAFAAAASETEIDGSWSQGICNWLGKKLSSCEVKAQNDSLAACKMFQQHYIQSCEADDIDSEAKAMAADACTFTGNWLAQTIWPLKGIFKPPKGPAFKACIKNAPSYMASAIKAACKGGKVNADTLCDKAFCSVWGGMESVASGILHCKDLPLPSACKNVL